MDNFSIPRSARNTLTALAVAAGITTGLSSCEKIEILDEQQPPTEEITEVPEKETIEFKDKLLNTKQFLGVYNTQIGDAEIDLETGERFYQFYNKNASNDSTKVYKNLFIEWNDSGHDGVSVIRDVKGTNELDVVHKYDSPDSTKLNSHHRVFLNEGGDTLFIASPKTKEVLATVVKGDGNTIEVTDKNGKKAVHEFFTDGNVIPPTPITFDPSVDGWENVDNNVDL